MSDISDVVDLDSIVGSTAVVLLFCGDEQAEIGPALDAELSWYERQSVRVLLVTAGDAHHHVPSGAATSITDASGELHERYWPGPHAWPATVVIGADGSMVARIEGGTPEMHLERLREAVAAHTSAEQPAPDERSL